jgi:hypothetical protein
MFEDLRKSASESYEEFKEEPTKENEPYIRDDRYNKPVKSRSSFLGMTAAQRFVLALILLLMSCVLSGFCLVLTGRISLPFF